jgi:hypothetical protein
MERTLLLVELHKYGAKSSSFPRQPIGGSQVVRLDTGLNARLLQLSSPSSSSSDVEVTADPEKDQKPGEEDVPSNENEDPFLVDSNGPDDSENPKTGPSGRRRWWSVKS